MVRWSLLSLFVFLSQSGERERERARALRAWTATRVVGSVVSKMDGWLRDLHRGIKRGLLNVRARERRRGIVFDAASTTRRSKNEERKDQANSHDSVTRDAHGRGRADPAIASHTLAS
jgi:hypothetical protein